MHIVTKPFHDMVKLPKQDVKNLVDPRLALSFFIDMETIIEQIIIDAATALFDTDHDLLYFVFVEPATPETATAVVEAIKELANLIDTNSPNLKLKDVYSINTFILNEQDFKFIVKTRGMKRRLIDEAEAETETAEAETEVDSTS